MSTSIWSQLSLVMGILTAMFALVDILLGVGHIFNGYGILSVMPLSVLGIILGIIGTR